MTVTLDNQPVIIRTERGLTISGTRITLYQLMDYIHASYPRHLIRNQFYLTNEQFDIAMSYIETHYEEVEREYQTVLQQAEEIRQYWKDRNKERLAEIAKLPLKPEYKLAWQKLQARKAKRTAASSLQGYAVFPTSLCCWRELRSRDRKIASAAGVKFSSNHSSKISPIACKSRAVMERSSAV